jgi:hypothetical protein
MSVMYHHPLTSPVGRMSKGTKYIKIIGESLVLCSF